MRKNMLLCALVMVLALILAGCGCDHEWYAATCSAPKTCSLCGEIEGEPLPHTWGEATCTNAKTCAVCKATEGNPLPHTWETANCTNAKTCTVCKVTEGDALGHTWQEATCTVPKTCSVCQFTEGEALGHIWEEATTEAPETCSVCKETTGSKLETDPRFTTKSTKALQGTWVSDVTVTDDMMGLENFGNLDCQMTMVFGKTGELTMRLAMKDEKAFMENYRTYTINLLYEAFAAENLSKEQADQAMVAAYGLNVPDYVDAALKNFNMQDLFAAFNSNEVYYVEADKVFTAMTWNATFDSNAFTITGDTLVIDGVAIEPDGEALVWTKVE